jgi:uncharacterized protein (DUF305 family)
MNPYKSAILAATLVFGLAGASWAQDAMPGHDMSAMGQMSEAQTESTLPEICRTGAEMDAMGTMAPMLPAKDEAHGALMAGMDAMNRDMMIGGMAEDIDVAFVCGMIPHHQGAISMAKAELEHGDDPWVKALAQKIIAAQEQEIADMQAWLDEQEK